MVDDPRLGAIDFVMFDQIRDSSDYTEDRFIRRCNDLEQLFCFLVVKYSQGRSNINAE